LVKFSNYSVNKNHNKILKKTFIKTPK